MSKTLKVGNLATEMTATKLTELCSEFGRVSNIRIAESPYSGKSRGFGFVEMSSIAEAEACVSGLNERVCEGLKLAVSSAPADQFKKTKRRAANGKG